MTFVSYEFLILLALVWPLHRMLPQRGRMWLLTIASYVFYGWWNPIYAALIAGSTLLHYASAIAIEESTSERRRRVIVTVAIAGSLGILAYFKYTNFAIDTLCLLLGQHAHGAPAILKVVLPLGISFYTFRDISYTVDVYRRDIRAERDFLLMALFVSFFPQLVAGPIERAKDIMPQLRARQPFRWEDMETGVRQFLWGLLKKLVADRLNQAALPPFADPAAHPTGELAFSALAMMIVVYLDFSAYSEMATGIARWFGIRLTRNFRYPQASGNIAEFWRQWHITMSTWVRDYLFMPLGGFHPRNLAHHARIMLITMGLVGLWHGANWTYVLFGLGHGVCLVAYHVLHLRVFRRLRRGSWLHSLPWRFGSWALTTGIRCLLGILFFAPDIARAGVFIRRLLLHADASGFNEGYVQLGFGLLVLFWMLHYVQSRVPMAERWQRLHPAVRGLGYAALVYIAMAVGVSTTEQFIYFQF